MDASNIQQGDVIIQQDIKLQIDQDISQNTTEIQNFGSGPPPHC